MKKTLIALAALAATGAVMAQSSVTIYGVIDQAVSHSSNSNGGLSKTELKSSANSTNRLGFRGVEDLGGGLKAKFQIESSLSADAPGATTLGERGAWVSLASDSMGEVRLGRDYNNAFWNPILFSAFGTNGVGATIMHGARLKAFTAAGHAVAATAALPANSSHYSDPYIWNNNSIGYILPGNLGGVYGAVQYAMDEQTAAGNSLGRDVNMRLGYANGPLNIALGYGKTDGLAAVDDIKSTNLGASYDFGMVKVMAVWSQDKATDGVTGAVRKDSGYSLGATMPMGTGSLRAEYSKIKTDVGAALDQKASKVAVGYVYPMSKRTSVYATLARVSNKNGATFTTGGTAPTGVNFSSTGYDFGITHSF